MYTINQSQPLILHFIHLFVSKEEGLKREKSDLFLYAER